MNRSFIFWVGEGSRPGCGNDVVIGVFFVRIWSFLWHRLRSHHTKVGRVTIGRIVHLIMKRDFF